MTFKTCSVACTDLQLKLLSYFSCVCFYSVRYTRGNSLCTTCSCAIPRNQRRKYVLEEQIEDILLSPKTLCSSCPLSLSAGTNNRSVEVRTSDLLCCSPPPLSPRGDKDNRISGNTNAVTAFSRKISSCSW